MIGDLATMWEDVASYVILKASARNIKKKTARVTLRMHCTVPGIQSLQLGISNRNTTHDIVK